MLGDSILTCDDLKRVLFPCPEWPSVDGALWVREMTAAERVSYSLSLGSKDEPNLANYLARIAVRVLCDKDGNRAFTDEQANSLGKKSAVVLERVVDATQALSGMTEEAKETLRKNSESDQQNDS